jgi:hypothetical protein
MTDGHERERAWPRLARHSGHDMMAVCAVRGFGYAMLHAAEVPYYQLQPCEPDHTVTPSPLVALCGQRVRTAQCAVWVLRWHASCCGPPPLDVLDGHAGRVCTHCERALAARLWPGQPRELPGLAGGGPLPVREYTFADLLPEQPAITGLEEFLAGLDPLRALAEALGEPGQYSFPDLTGPADG